MNVHKLVLTLLKVGYNKNFGYYIEVTKANIGRLATDRYNVYKR